MHRIHRGLALFLAIVLLGAVFLPAGGEARAEGGDYSGFTACYYQNATTSTNHEVLIVGWDDNYPAENFANSPAGLTPSGNGAWLCRNSYGSGWGEDGYFWVSYFDRSIYVTTSNSIGARATVFDFRSAGNYDNNYEYDGAVIQGWIYDGADGTEYLFRSGAGSVTRWYANVFTVRGNSGGTEILQAVSTYSYYAGVPYTISVYTDLADETDPASGVLAASQSGSFPYAGFHTIPLSSPVSMEEAHTFSVVISIGAASNDSLYIPACYTNSNWKSVNEALPGQSFVSPDGSAWTDCAGMTNSPNVRIKAYTANVGGTGIPMTDEEVEAARPKETEQPEETETPEETEPPEETELPEETEPPEETEQPDGIMPPDETLPPEASPGPETTPEPITPEPVTPEPITPEPITPEPVTPEPITPEPVTPEPVTPEPVTPEPVTPEPVTPEPVTPEP
ncbi:MAG: hypothetical protein IKD79_02400, partial [Oscillospiraceae bacterium]|nr:hypothetical protein [Oscillospiraceae bacterium]